MDGAPATNHAEHPWWHHEGSEMPVVTLQQDRPLTLQQEEQQSTQSEEEQLWEQEECPKPADQPQNQLQHKGPLTPDSPRGSLS